jgi:hypothetical protein
LGELLMKLYVHMTEQERRRADRKHEKMLLNLKQDAEDLMQWWDILSPEMRELIRQKEEARV